MTQTIPRLICLLGMHRSGTSFLAGELATAGLCLGNANRSGSAANAKGNQEYQPIVIFHENALKAAGGSWDHPPQHLVWQTHQQERALELARQLVGECPPQSVCGFKDPRTLLFWNEWKTLPLELQPVGTFRHPFACADSLAHRSRMTQQQAIALWLHYNRALLAIWEADPFPLLDFDSPEHRITQDTGRIAQWLGLPNSPTREFLDESLRHHQPRGNTGHSADTFADALALHARLQEASATFWSLAATTANN